MPQPIPNPKIWKCGETGRYVIPTAGKDPWRKCLFPLLEEDKAKCEAWVDEVQNLLLFAGLFSAVITAFVIESYQCLQGNQNATLTNVLVGIATQLNSLSNGTSSFPSTFGTSPQAVYHPSSSSIRINIFWFLSLILSLTTVLVGIVALQWIREYQRYPNSLSSKRKFAARNLRAEAFDEWFVPQILAGLPLLLQAALVLFFAGLIDFLLNLSLYVAIPVIIVIAITLLFLLLTTVVPAAQAFWLLNRRAVSIPIQCPYKSSQSWAFLRFASSWIIRFSLNFIGDMTVNVILIPAAPIIYITRFWDFDFQVWNFVEYLQVSYKLKRLAALENWTHFDLFWMDERQRTITKSSASCTFFTKITGNMDYDAARGLAHAINDGHMQDDALALSIYHCFQQLPRQVITDQVFDLMSKSLPGWMTPQKATRKASMLDCPGCYVAQENEMFLLSRLPQTTIIQPTHLFRKRQLELFVPTLAYIFVVHPWAPGGSADLAEGVSASKKQYKPGELLVPVCVKTLKGISGLPPDLASDLRQQLSMIFDSFINLSISGADHLTSFKLCYAEPILVDFMKLMAVITLSTITSCARGTDSHSPDIPTTQNIEALSTLTNAVQSMVDSLTMGINPTTKRLTFHIGIVYVSHFHYTEWASICHRAPLFSDAFTKLVERLQHYQHNVMGGRVFQFHYFRHSNRWNELVGEILKTRQVSYRHVPDVYNNINRTTQMDTVAQAMHSFPNISQFEARFSAVQVPGPAVVRIPQISHLNRATVMPNGLM